MSRMSNEIMIMGLDGTPVKSGQFTTKKACLSGAHDYSFSRLIAETSILIGDMLRIANDRYVATNDELSREYHLAKLALGKATKANRESLADTVKSLALELGDLATRSITSVTTRDELQAGNAHEFTTWAVIVWEDLGAVFTECLVSLVLSGGGHDGGETAVSATWRVIHPETGEVCHLTTPKNALTYVRHCGCKGKQRGYIGQLTDMGDTPDECSSAVIGAVNAIRGAIMGGTMANALNAVGAPYVARHLAIKAKA